jgi:hypothetical protein
VKYILVVLDNEPGYVYWQGANGRLACRIRIDELGRILGVNL